ncbi:thioredoxin family protein, partial [Candidatus Bathyarchaeota archaeon]|nr:thioredoxin family protein [Candidatus Bathyarchaeota archaeon]
KITILSLACCDPSLAVYDQQYVSRIKEATSKIGVEAEVEVISGADAFFGLKVGYMRKLRPLFDKYGTAVAPALFIDGELVLYGGVPTVEKLAEVIEKNSKKNNV